MAAIAPAELMFFGDINCPFCFVENERLNALGVGAALQWRGVEHDPEIPNDWSLATAAMDAELEKEIAALAVRAPDIEVRKPEHRPNSRLAIATIAAALRIAPDQAATIRTALFRALWQDCRDVSDPDVVADVCRAAGAPALPPSRDDRAQVRIWTVEWDAGGFDRRIPVVATTEGQRLLGLAETESLADFIADSSAGGHGPDVCRG